ncbi:MAG: hypothetical protein AAGA54_00980 [Myxococcota bacterium]
MSDRDPKDSSSVDDLLAPPPFGVAESTGENLLPIPTSMEELLDSFDGPQATEPSEEPDPKPVPVAVPAAPVAEPIPAVAPPAAPAAQPAPVVLEPEPSSDRMPIIVGVAALLLALGGGALWLTSKASEEDAATKTATDEGAPTEAAATPEGAVPAPPRKEAAVAPSLPTSLEALRELSYADRHTRLAAATEDVDVELHVGLDLVQSEGAEDPCRTFADALSTIEAAEDREPYGWALDEAQAPAGSSAACSGLSERLAAVKADGEPAPSTPSRGASSKRSRRRSKPSRATPTPAPTPAAEPKAPPPAEKPKPARSPSVATKLDDDLRGLGE